MIRVAALYLSFALAASAALAEDWAAVESLRQGDMEKLHFSDPIPAPLTVFHGVEGQEMTLADVRGRWAVVNFWATWCAPCREEMPTLSALQAQVPDLAVVTIATGRNDPIEMTAFFAEIGVDNLPLYTDPRQHLARDMGVLGLPATVILDPEGNEVARLLGDALWDSDSALAIFGALASQ